jgi:hypothetical protein
MDKNEVLKYLGYSEQVIDDDMTNRIEKAMSAMSKIEGKFIYKIFDFKIDDEVHVLETVLKLKGKSIKHILSQSEQLILFAGTLGPEADQLIHKSQYASSVDMMILDACASVRVEEILDHMEDDISLYKTPRFSPGYGDLDLSIQKELIEVLEGRRIGITVTDSSLLIPKKSVTGIIGLSKSVMDVSYRFCDDCLKRTSCDFKICSREKT